MNAVVIRDKTTRKIMCMGPADGMYDHRCDPATQTKQIEPNYDALMAEHLAELAAQPKSPTLEERVAALEAKG